MDIRHAGPVTVVVITYNDAEHVATAVRSALDQGAAVGEVVVVDDCSTDGTAGVLAELAADERVRVLTRMRNSGGCGTPRNDGLAAASTPYVMFLDSDDVLQPGAADALLAAARAASRGGDDPDAPGAVDVVAGQAVRRELPGGREKMWAPQLYDPDAGAQLPREPLRGIGEHPDLMWDTLSVNKLYRRGFLVRHRIGFPDGAFHYEDFVFTARVNAARPRLLLTSVPVYVWQVRRQAANLSISLRRAQLKNWTDRIAAHRAVVDVFRESGDSRLVDVAQRKFLSYDLPMYLRELPQRDAEHRTAWWRVTRDYLAGFDPAALASAAPVVRWIAAVLAALPEPPDPATTTRLVELAAARPRLAPPYHGDAAAPVFGPAPADVPLADLDAIAPADLPVTVEGEFTVGASLRLDLRVHDLYGRLAALRPASVRVELAESAGLRPPVAAEAALRADGDGWTARVVFRARDVAPDGAVAQWPVHADLVCAGGVVAGVEVRAGHEGRERPRLVLAGSGGPLVVRVHVTPRRALVLRTASSLDGARHAAQRLLKR